MKNLTMKYGNEELTIVWKPTLCAHSGLCVRGLPAVFDNKRRPWIDVTGAASSRIREQVKLCPSGALSILATPASSD